MSLDLTHYLLPIQRRLQRQAMLRAASRGAMLGGSLGVGLGLIRSAIGGPLVGSAWDWPLACAVNLGPAVVAALVARIRPIDPLESARRVDRHYGLADRALTALSLRHETGNVVELQRNDALRHVQQAAPAAIVPRLLPAAWPQAVALLVAGLLLSFLPLSDRSADLQTAAEGGTAVARLPVSIGPALSARSVSFWNGSAEGEYPDQPAATLDGPSITRRYFSQLAGRAADQPPANP